MSTIYSINFENETPDTWTLCVYQTLPDSPGLDSVSWKQTKVPTHGSSGVQWEIQYLACLADYKQTGGKGVYKASQKLPTSLGKAWDCVYMDDVQQLIASGTTTDGQLLLANKSQKLANLAIGMDGDIALVKSNVYSGNNAQFVVKPKYYVALYTNLTQGEVISGNQVHGPLEVVFAGGETEKNYVARIEGSNFIFEETNSNYKVVAPYAQVLERAEQLENRSKELAL